MHRQFSFIVYCVTLGLIAALTTTLQSELKFSEQALSDHRNNSRFEDATINAYDNKGNLLYLLNSPQIHYRADQRFEFEQPKFVYQVGDGTPLNLSASKGYMENNSALIELLGDVNISHINPQNDMAEYLDTSDATIDLDKKKAYTDAKATFRQQNKITEGIGMVADLEEQTIKLQSNIKVLAVP